MLTWLLEPPFAAGAPSLKVTLCTVPRMLMWQLLHNRQVNYLGPYLLTRLLEPSLAAGAPSRVVNLSSVMSRFGELTNPRDYLRQPNRGGEDYAASKLANVLFSYEAQRRLSPLGIQVILCAFVKVCETLTL